MLRSIDLACERTPSCASAGTSPSTLLSRVLAQVRRTPYEGRAADADGKLRHIRVTPEALVSVAFGATYGPATYAELPGALRAALHGYRDPLLRLTAESVYGGSGGDPADYSEGLDAAVSCHDYPQLYDMTATPDVRRAEYADSVRAQIVINSQIYAPFTVGEYLRSDWEMADWCLNWPVAPTSAPAGPPAPPSGSYPAVPTLVLSGELDSITTPAEGALIASEFPAAHQVIVANSFHVTADGDTDNCAVQILRQFVARPRTGLTARRVSCANQVPPLRAVADYGRSYRDGSAARALPGSAVGGNGLHAAASAVRTAADLLDRWFDNYSGSGHGLHGGTWSYTGDRVVHFRVKNVRLTQEPRRERPRDLGALLAHCRGASRHQPGSAQRWAGRALTGQRPAGRALGQPRLRGAGADRWSPRRSRLGRPASRALSAARDRAHLPHHLASRAVAAA